MTRTVPLHRSILRRVRIAVLTTVIAVAGLLAVGPTPAHASASGCSVYGTIQSPWIPIPTGWECFDVYGSGTKITSMRASWRATNLCNWRIDWAIYYQGRTWWRDQGPAHNHCDYVAGNRTRGAGSGPKGSQICAELYNTSRNVKIEAVCHNIT